jgi:hypothetical protein
VNPDGLGQALIYPYYTARSTDGNPFNTYVTIVNTDGTPKAVRVRFREGRNGREVAGFNLVLGWGDTWAGVVTPTGDGARLLTADRSCTAPAFASLDGQQYMDFGNAAYIGDGFGDTLDRAREGYIEVIEMATLTDGFGARVPTCDDFRADRNISAFVSSRAGGLSGTLTLINVANGMDFTVNAEALSDMGTRPFYRPASDSYPDFNAAEITPVSAFLYGGKLYRTTWNSGFEAVHAALIRSTLENELVLDTPTLSGTDWVVTLPSRRFFAGAPELPVSLTFHARDDVIAYAPGVRLTWVSTVLTFRASSAPSGAGTSEVFGSQNAWLVSLPGDPQSGSVSLGFTAPLFRFEAATVVLADGSTANQSLIMVGYAALGFMARTFRNGTLACDAGACQGNYGGAFPHKYTKNLCCATN